MRGLLGDLLLDVFVSPLADYFVHGLPPGRILLRIVNAVLFCCGTYLTFLGPPAFRPLGVAALVVGSVLLVYDTVTLGRYGGDDARSGY